MRAFLGVQNSKVQLFLHRLPLPYSVDQICLVWSHRISLLNRSQHQLYQNANFAARSMASRSKSIGPCEFAHASACMKLCHFRYVSSRAALSQKHDRHAASKSERKAQEPRGKPALKKQTEAISRTIHGRLSPIKAHENIYTIPNMLTFSRLVAAPVTGFFILHDEFAWATALLFYAGVTDLVDGWIARRWNLQTVVGSVIDPMADKALMTILTVCLAVQGGLPIWLATIILGRDVSLAIAAIYYRYASLPPPKSFTRYWDFSLPSAEVHPTAISKANTLLQLLLIGATTALPVAGPTISAWLSDLESGLDLDTLVAGGQYVVATTTVWSGLSYLYTRKAVKILGVGEEESTTRILRRGKAVLGVSFLICLATALALEST